MKTIMFILFALISGFLGRDGTPHEPSTQTLAVERNNRSSDSQEVSLLRRVQEIITPKCGSCHTSTLPTAKPGAVRIFDLAQNNWPSTMSVKQLGAFRGRLSNLQNPDKQIIEQFVQLEISKRNQVHQGE